MKLTQLINKTTKSVHYVLLVEVEEANMKSLDKLYYLEHVANSGLLKIKIDKIFGVYSTFDHLKNDYIPDTMKNVVFIANSELVNNLDTKPVCYKTFNKNKLKRINIEDVLEEGDDVYGQIISDDER
ncbi:hypothetical protein GCM10008934_20940 [Virgibacillus salarius]|uniref:hypothetical protein n=1 Tax=Virgibacillus salarius TaxID=447199 RepID=UPI0031E28043